MNRVLVSGLGNAADMGLCDACELNFSWLANFPSVLIWCDEICLPQKALAVQKSSTEDKSDLAINLFLDLANDAKLIKPIDLSPLQEAGLGKSIMKQVAEDSAELLACDPSIKKGNRDVPGEIIINDRGYCTAIQSSIYTSILSADLLEANCLFSNSEKLYLEKLYAVKNRMHPQHNTAAAFSEVFSLYLPENLSLHEYAFHSEEKCKECKHYDSCKTTYLADTEKSIKKVLEWRNYDEIQRAKEELDKIIRQRNSLSSQADFDEIRLSYEERQHQINKNIRSVFPKIERWTKLATFIATPIAIAASVYAGNVPLTLASTAIPGISNAIDAGVDYYKNKHNWVSFINQLPFEK